MKTIKIKPHKCVKCLKSNRKTEIAKVMCVICKSPLCNEHMKEHIEMLKRNIKIPDVESLSIFIKKNTKQNEYCLLCEEKAQYVSYSNKYFCEKHISFYLIDEFSLCENCKNELALFNCHYCHLSLCKNCAITHSSPRHKPFLFRIANETEEFNPRCSICKKSTHIFSFVISNTICPECLKA